MKNINEIIYSKEPFEGYKFRAKVEIDTGESHLTSFDVYTTSTDRIGTELTLRGFLKYPIMPLKIIHWSSKQQDEESSKFIDEVMKSIENHR